MKRLQAPKKLFIGIFLALCGLIVVGSYLGIRWYKSRASVLGSSTSCPTTAPPSPAPCISIWGDYSQTIYYDPNLGLAQKQVTLYFNGDWLSYGQPMTLAGPDLNYTLKVWSTGNLSSYVRIQPTHVGTNTYTITTTGIDGQTYTDSTSFTVLLLSTPAPTSAVTSAPVPTANHNIQAATVQPTATPVTVSTPLPASTVVPISTPASIGGITLPTLTPTPTRQPTASTNQANPTPTATPANTTDDTNVTTYGYWPSAGADFHLPEQSITQNSNTQQVTNAAKNNQPQTKQTDPEKYNALTNIIPCLQQSLSQNRILTLGSGQDSATPEERSIVESCYANRYGQQRPTVVFHNTASLDQATQSCLATVLGSDRLNELTQFPVTATPQEQTKADGCFAFANNPLLPPVIFQVDQQTQQCLNNVIDQNKLEQLIQGKTTLNATQMSQAQACFATINALQTKLLPPPPVQIPFMPVDQFSMSQATAKTTYQKGQSSKLRPIPQLSGHALPNTELYLYLFSDPIVVTIRTDANGTWSYNLDAPLSQGKHTAYVALKRTSNAVVRSEVTQFTVAQAAASTDREGGLVITQSAFQDQLKQYVMLAVAIITFGIFMLLLLLSFRSRPKFLTAPAEAKPPETKS